MTAPTGDVIYGRKGEIHHLHAVVPGCKYIVFLTNILDFLAEHPSEIVFVELKSDGFAVHEDKKDAQGVVKVYSMIPSVEELQECLNKARSAAASDTGRAIQIGHASDLDRPIGELISEQKRLIIVDRVHDPEAWDRADSYDHVACLYFPTDLFF